jgi:hypothetical protein
MASQEVSGRTAEELEDLRENKTHHMPFEEKYCLAKIPRQPDDYDGPPRYCCSMNVNKIGSSYRCKHHGGAGHGNPENMEPGANMSHGLHATQDNLRKNFDDKDWALYEWITDTYPEAYDIDIESDPMAAYDIHRLASEIVRAERGRGHVIKEGEVHEQDRYSSEGALIIDDRGDVVTEKSAHYLADMLHKQDNKVTKLEKTLGITRRQRMKRDEKQDTVEALTKGFAELGDAFLRREDKDYDPDDEPWEEDNE